MQLSTMWLVRSLVQPAPHRAQPRGPRLGPAILMTTKYNVNGDCDMKLSCGMPKKCGDKHGWYAVARGQ